MINIRAELPEILKELIAVESVTGEEKEICDILEKTMAPFDGTLIREENSLVFHLDRGKEKRIALIGHIDTVPLGNSTTEAYEKDSMLFGRGACDMKAGLAVMLKIISDESIGAISLSHNLSFYFYSGEEGPVPNGINTLLDRGHFKNVDFAFILEPTESRYSVGCLGSLAVKKEVFGVSAHSANPRTGENALNKSLQIYEKIREMDGIIGSDRTLDGLLYYETVNVTALNTFNAFNVLPPRAELMINYRFSPERSLEEAKELLFASIGAENTVIVDEADSSYAGEGIDHYLMEGIDREIMQAWTDIAQLNAAGIPSINFGPGSIRHAHKPDEHINLKDFSDFYKSMIFHL
ncbi:M20/M25/M40 family metallo-hydrolase [Spirochaeta isovalerica]|uniref:Succinyl-diaminopimelate desuccinylase n=1 Tax=Spirochaeta isovalerica TaxID=150 RepID=A0A841R8A6_9SPIO|nr:M20/M25/M40 family metallo-hydrolase [Spirochaeta isovalerica]MBB6480113.1 succinyl-diaminopimelate desuccinylase [Spirochaeta isovalerica]